MTIRLIDQQSPALQGKERLGDNKVRRGEHVGMSIMLGGILLIGLGTLHPDVSSYSEVGKIRLVVLLFFLACLAFFLPVLRGIATWPGFLLAIDDDELVYPVRRSFFWKWKGRYAAIDAGSVIRVDTKYPDRAGIRLFVWEKNAHIADTEALVEFEPLVGELSRPPTEDNVLVVGFPTGSREETERWAETIRKFTQAR